MNETRVREIVRQEMKPSLSYGEWYLFAQEVGVPLGYRAEFIAEVNALPVFPLPVALTRIVHLVDRYRESIDMPAIG